MFGMDVRLPRKAQNGTNVRRFGGGMTPNGIFPCGVQNSARQHPPIVSKALQLILEWQRCASS
jgi:hypothetical protein